jgi:hypothetical protein
VDVACANCGTTYSEWAPRCPSCSSDQRAADGSAPDRRAGEATGEQFAPSGGSEPHVVSGLVLGGAAGHSHDSVWSRDGADNTPIWRPEPMSEYGPLHATSPIGTTPQLFDRERPIVQPTTVFDQETTPPQANDAKAPAAPVDDPDATPHWWSKRRKH